MKFLSLANAIKLMIIIGLVAVFSVIVQSCQPAKSGLDGYRVNSLKRLQVMDVPPIQPPGTYFTSDKRKMMLRDYRGKYVLLNVWATWCPPCVAEMPSLNKLAGLRGGQAFEVVTISMDRDAADADAFLEKYDLDNLTAWHDKNLGLSAQLRVQGLPVSVIYDPNGQEIARVSGEADWTSDEALALIDYLLARPKF